MKRIEKAFHLENWAMDDKARIVVCDICGARGDVMSIEWNYDKKAQAWEPQERHWPKCKHFQSVVEST